MCIFRTRTLNHNHNYIDDTLYRYSQPKFKSSICFRIWPRAQLALFTEMKAGRTYVVMPADQGDWNEVGGPLWIWFAIQCSLNKKGTAHMHFVWQCVLPYKANQLHKSRIQWEIPFGAQLRYGCLFWQVLLKKDYTYMLFSAAFTL